MAYDDGRVACTEDGLVIRKYYFPFGAKRLPYAKIQGVRSQPMDEMTGRARIWGSSDFQHWFNLDPHRPRKSVALVIQPVGHNIRPVITPDNPEAVLAELTRRGVTVTSVLLQPAFGFSLRNCALWSKPCTTDP